MSAPIDLATQLHALADQVDHLKPGEVIGTLEKIKFEVWTNANSAPIAPPAPTVALDIDEVSKRTGMSKPWLYREARADRLPFARRIGRRLVFDEAGLTRWLARRTTR
jgi:predicted DNA-binding transcriptional regulator AlpA